MSTRDECNTHATCAGITDEQVQEAKMKVWAELQERIWNIAHPRARATIKRRLRT